MLLASLLCVPLIPSTHPISPLLRQLGVVLCKGIFS